MSAAHKAITRESVTLDAAVAARASTVAFAVGGIGLVASGIGFLSQKEQFFHSYLWAYSFCLTLALGGLFFTIIQHLVGAHWSVVVRRIAETFMANILPMAVLSVPILVGIHELYHWTHAHTAKNGGPDPLLIAKEGYLNIPFFIARLALYFAVWLLISRYFYKRSIASDEGDTVDQIRAMRRMAPPSVLAYALTQTFAALDLLMSLDPHWYSTIFGVYIFGGTAISTFSLIALTALWLRSQGKLEHTITHEHYHDLGKLMFGFTVFWTYIAFSQYFLIWYANMPEETLFYLHRGEGSWKPVSIFLVLGRFVIPFVILMSRHVKRTLPVLGIMCVWLLAMQLLDLYWLIMPNLHHHGVHVHWLDITCLAGLGGIFFALAIRRLAQHPLVPINDPYLRRSMEFENV